MSSLNDLKPRMIWHYFQEILKIPRPSDHEEQIRNYLIEFAISRGFYHKTDGAGNLVIRKDATKGMESAPAVCLQSHLDMVCEKNSDVSFNFFKDPIIARVEGDWVKASGTTLGADDGIGIAAQLAILDSDDLIHGPLECLFTVAEETGLTGAFGLENGFLRSSILLNLDSEDEGELYIGCAGGIDLTAWFDFTQEPVPPGFSGMELMVKGLKGGHSGDDIHKGFGNANKIMNRFLWESSDDLEIRIHLFDGGNLRNALAREARVIAAMPSGKAGEMKVVFNSFAEKIKKEFAITEPDLELTISECPVPDWTIDEDCHFNLINSLYACPHGVHAWSQTIPGLVETSTNLAAVKFENGRIKVTTSQRSSVSSAKMDISQMVESVFLLAGAESDRSTGYPGWAPNPNSPVLEVTHKAYINLFGEEPKIKAIHAGLECGLFLEKYPHLDMVSFGPTIKGAHSPDERLLIPTVDKFWLLLTEVLKKIK
jgi:dipeptidase D